MSKKEAKYHKFIAAIPLHLNTIRWKLKFH